eukprot:2049642-Pleurochrysis_carterae.AAC.5
MAVSAYQGLQMRAYEGGVPLHVILTNCTYSLFHARYLAHTPCLPLSSCVPPCSCSGGQDSGGSHLAAVYTASPTELPGCLVAWCGGEDVAGSQGPTA